MRKPNLLHSKETMRRRRRLSNTWAGMVLAWAFIRTLLVWAAVGDYGLNPWVYLAIDLCSAATDAVTTPRMVLSFIDEHYRQAVGWGLIALVAFIVPDVYIFLGTRHLPTNLIIIICSVIGVTLIIAVVSVLRKIHKGRMERAAGPRDRVCLNIRMKAAVLFESLTGHTRTAAELIASNLQQAGWGITGVSPVRKPEMASIQDADMIIIGTWVHGLFVVGQAPWGLGAIAGLPAMQGKLAATFCTFALNPAKTLDKLDGAVSRLGAEVVGGLALHRSKLAAHSEEFAARLVANVPTRV